MTVTRYSEDQLAEFRRIHRSRRSRRFYSTAISMLVLLVLFTAISVSDDRPFGLDGFIVIPALVVVLMISLYFEYRNTRCPACGGGIGNMWSQRFCPTCGVRLVD